MQNVLFWAQNPGWVLGRFLSKNALSMAYSSI